MDGVISLLDERHDTLVKELWSDLEREFGSRGANPNPVPHFSYHVAPAYDEARLDPIVRQCARQTAAFRVQTRGLGTFTGPEPVLYILVTRSPLLSHVHHLVWHAVEPTAVGSQRYYHPEQWKPHITLAFGATIKEALPDMIRLLNERDLYWDLDITSLAFTHDTETSRELRFHYDLVSR